MNGILFREESGQNGPLFFRLPVPERKTGGKRFADYYGGITALLSSLPGDCGFTSVIGNGRTYEGRDGTESVLLFYRLYRGESLADCLLLSTVWDADGNAVPLSRLIGKKERKRAAKKGYDGFYAGKDGAVFCRYRREDDGNGRNHAVFREAETVPFSAEKRRDGWGKSVDVTPCFSRKT